jgi:hypothetical protein
MHEETAAKMKEIEQAFERNYVIRPQAEGLYATTFVATSCQASRAMCHVTCRVLCCSVALLLCTLCGYRAGCILTSLLSI